MNEAMVATGMASENERTQVRAQEHIAMFLALGGAGLAALVSPWWLFMAVFFALAHWMMVDEAERVGAHEHKMERSQRVAEQLISSGVNAQFDAEGVPRSHRAARFEIHDLRIKRDGEDGLTVKAWVQRDDGAWYAVTAEVPTSGSERAPSVQVSPESNKERSE
ncbi:hypothetical protein [Thioalkalivibrio sp. ALE16]|uniref:hypothetical protein n=1 Tax=Thioalkalivibrio sp. ALE16 TaxID=1158172 RepID=UPI0012DD31BE|nr:hypothetical protein [Thioalkalivibrio sp. ALE16]